MTESILADNSTAEHTSELLPLCVSGLAIVGMAQVFCAACQHIVFLSLLHARLVPLTLETSQCASQVKDIQQLPTISFFTFLPEFNMLCHSVMSQTPLTPLFTTPSLFATLIGKVPFLGPKPPIPTGVGACAYYIKSNQRLFARPTRILINRLPNRSSIRGDRPAKIRTMPDDR